MHLRIFSTEAEARICCRRLNENSSLVAASVIDTTEFTKEHIELAEAGVEKGDSMGSGEAVVNNELQNNRNASDIPLASLRPTRNSATDICSGSSIVTDDGKTCSSYNGPMQCSTVLVVVAAEVRSVPQLQALTSDLCYECILVECVEADPKVLPSGV